MIEDQAKFFKALGDKTRLTIVGYLLNHEHCACDFTEMKDKDQTTISRHLKVLNEAGITKFRKDGRNVVHSIRNAETRQRLMSMGIEPQDACCEVKPPTGAGVKDLVKKRYGKIAKEGAGCGCGISCCAEGRGPVQISMSLGYSQEELNGMDDSNLGLGCGHPGSLGMIMEGETVLDLGSGAGLDAFLALKKVGATGKVIGVDLTREMITKSVATAKRRGLTNIEFRLGDIEDLPVESDSVDVVLSNCVINLVPDKTKAFSEAHRVLRSGGRLLISDMVLLKELTAEQRGDEDLITGCVGGAILRDEYLDLIKGAGFHLENVVDDKKIGESQYRGLPVESVKIVAIKR